MDDSDLIARLANVPTANAKQILRALGVTRTVLLGLRRMTTERRIAGRARTLRFLPYREDATPPSGSINRTLIDTLNPGDVLVSETGGFREGAVMGDMLATRAFARGCVAHVTDGMIRDIEGIRESGLPIWACGTFPDAQTGAILAWDIDLAVRIGGTLVIPGDYILADEDAAMVVPAQHAEAVIAKSHAMLLEDIFSQQELRAGKSLADAYPIPESRRTDFEAFKVQHSARLQD